MQPHGALETGLDRALRMLAGERCSDVDAETARLLQHGRLGLITHPAAVTGDLQGGPEALRQAGAHLTALFGPEHGVRGDALDGEAVPDAVDSATGLPAYSLYGETRKPTAEMLHGLDALVYDLQDIGARCYTFTSTLTLAMEAAAEAGLPLIVLDRPNPLGGATEGPVLEPEFASFVGRYPVPLRHGLTPAEFALTAHHVWGVGEEPLIVPMRGYLYDHLWHELGRIWLPPSPAIPTAETASVYPGTVLLEGTNVSEGRGTALPFRQFGAPWLRGLEITAALNGMKLPGIRFRSTWFQPSQSKFSTETCSGVAIHVVDARTVRPVAMGVAILATVRRLHPDQFEWRVSGDRFTVDRLAGTARLRELVDAGPPVEFIESDVEINKYENSARRLDAYR